jgi:hypothetical protein
VVKIAKMWRKLGARRHQNLDDLPAAGHTHDRVVDLPVVPPDEVEDRALPANSRFAKALMLSAQGGRQVQRGVIRPVDECNSARAAQPLRRWR